MKTGKMILLLGSVLGVFTILAGCDRVDTSDPNATPKPTPTATANPTTDKIDITDDFEDPQSGWGRTDEAEKEDYHYYFDGAYKMHLSGEKTKYFAVQFNNTLDADKGYTIQVKVTNSTAENAAVGGLFFNSNGDDGGIFVVDPKNKKYALQNGRSNFIWLDISSINPTNTTNTYELKIVVSGTKVTDFSINGTSVKSSIRVPNHLGEKVGLYLSFKEGEKNITMTYDDFKAQGTKYSSN